MIEQTAVRVVERNMQYMYVIMIHLKIYLKLLIWFCNSIKQQNQKYFYVL